MTVKRYRLSKKTGYRARAILFLGIRTLRNTIITSRDQTTAPAPRITFRELAVSTSRSHRRRLAIKKGDRE